MPPLASLGPALLQQDNQQLKAYHEWQQAAADADRAFDAEVGIDPEEMPSSIQSPSMVTYLVDGVSLVQNAQDIKKVVPLDLVRLDDGTIKVIPEKSPADLLDYWPEVSEDWSFELSKTYTAEEVASITQKGLLRGAWSKGNWLLGGTLALIENAWEFGHDPEEGDTFWERTVLNREFWVSVAVDTAISVAIGVAAAALVAGAIAVLVTIGFTAAASAPLWLIVGVTTGLAIYLGAQIEDWGVPEILKTKINRELDNISERR